MSTEQCPDCGAPFRPGEPACPECGVELYDDAEPEGLITPADAAELLRNTPIKVTRMDTHKGERQ